jgi:hypothetical protein
LNNEKQFSVWDANLSGKNGGIIITMTIHDGNTDDVDRDGGEVAEFGL